MFARSRKAYKCEQGGDNRFGKKLVEVTFKTDLGASEEQKF